jgi:hypothetical protein
MKVLNYDLTNNLLGGKKNAKREEEQSDRKLAHHEIEMKMGTQIMKLFLLHQYGYDLRPTTRKYKTILTID